MKVLRSMLKESKSKILQFEHANGFRICLVDKTVVKRIAPAFPGPFVIFLRCVDNWRRLYFVRHPCPPARLLPYSYHFQYILPCDTTFSCACINDRQGCQKRAYYSILRSFSLQFQRSPFPGYTGDYRRISLPERSPYSGVASPNPPDTLRICPVV